MIGRAEGSWRWGSVSLSRGPMEPGSFLNMASSTCNQTCRYCNSELPVNSRQLVLHWQSMVSLLAAVRRSGGEPRALGDG